MVDSNQSKPQIFSSEVEQNLGNPTQNYTKLTDTQSLRLAITFYVPGI